MYQVDEEKLEAFADAFTMVKEDVSANEFQAARFALLLCEGYALLESIREQRVERERVTPAPPKKPVSTTRLFAKVKRNA